MLDIYNQRSRWKIYLGLAGIFILLISLYYTNYLAQRLREGERNKASLLFYAYDAINQANDPALLDVEADLSLPLNIIESNKDIPIMWVSHDDKVLYGRNFGP
ncbi:MAG: two-component sensor histidine kinase, partial [Saprospiraceae bacterium]